LAQAKPAGVSAFHISVIGFHSEPERKSLSQIESNNLVQSVIATLNTGKCRVVEVAKALDPENVRPQFAREQ
jgi:hypothetical protein